MAALALGGAGMAAPVQAASSAQPGQTVGLPAGAPFAVGLYFVNTSSFGIRSTEPRGTELNINLPSFIWATPWTVAGGRLQFVVLQPIAASSTRGAAYQSGFGQTLLAGQIAWAPAAVLAVGYSAGAELGARLAVRGGERVIRPVLVVAVIALAGRMPLSNYLLQTALASALFYGWGLGLWNTTGPALETAIAIVLFCAVQLPLSAAWLAYFRQGPLEALWRRFTYGAPAR